VLTSLPLFIAGLTILLVGAELLVRGASRAAALLRVSPLVIGLTVVAFGTSSPEFAITLRAAFTDYAADMALGNVVGSNIANVLLVLGLAAALSPIVVTQRVIRVHAPAMVAASVLMGLLALDGSLSGGDGLVLLAALGGYITLTLLRDRRILLPATTPPAPNGGGGRAAIQIAAGALLLGTGAWLLVEAATSLAAIMGVSELLIGLTAVAVGTSLPELATTVAAFRQGEQQMAVGNILGSNIFNVLAILGTAAILAPHGVPVPAQALYFDLPVMTAVAIACLPVFLTGHSIARWEGWLFLGYYVAYCGFLFLAATEHAAQGLFGTSILLFALPLTLLTLAVGVIRHLRRASDRLL